MLVNDKDLPDDIPPRVVYVLGATAAGKSRFAVKLAQYLRCSILSADAFQVYRDFGIASDKITETEMEGVLHYGIDIVDAAEAFSVTQFLTYAVPLIDSEISSGRSVVVVGGTNMYIEKLLFTSRLDELGIPSVTNDLDDEVVRGPDSLQYVHSELLVLDPAMAAKLHPNDGRRIKKAIEHYLSTGTRLSETLENQNRQLRWPNTVVICKTTSDDDKSLLESNIRSRVFDKMIAGGKLHEELMRLKELIEREKLHWGKGILQSIGYREFKMYLERYDEVGDAVRGQLFHEATKDVIQDTIRYAKKQKTWIRKLDKLIASCGLCGRISYISQFEWDKIEQLLRHDTQDS